MAAPSDVSTAGSAPGKVTNLTRPKPSIPESDEDEKGGAVGGGGGGGGGGGANGHVHFVERTISELKRDDEDDEEEDLDALIEELESLDPDADPDEELDETEGTRMVPEEMLQTDTRTGLNEPEVLLRLKKYGLNQMREEKENLVKKFLTYFVGPIQFVMEAAAIMAAGLRDWVDFGVICALLVLNASVGFIQEFQAGSIVEELKKQLALKAVVLREGRLIEIEAPMVVPGDILQLEEGTIIPADGRIVTEQAYLQVDQSSITGESLSVEKSIGDTCFASSAVKRGTCFMVVTATGDHSFVGRAAALVNKASGGHGHFTEVLNGIGIVLLALVIFTLLVVWISSFYRGNGIVQILRFTLAITIIGVPVGLPAVVTTTMAVGAAYLAKKKAIVQKLSAIESLAGVEILCSDKTGTLTKNRLSLHEPFCVPGVEPDDLMLTACLAASRKRKGMDAIDKAFFKALKNYPRAKSVLTKYKCIEFHPFDPVSKKISAIVEAPGTGERIICVKGAPLFVLKTVEDAHPIPEEIETAYKNKVAEFAQRGFRSLGVARRREDESWEILGIMPCADPPRHDTAKTINEAKSLGLSIKMLTGDAVGIARETSRQLGLGTNVFNAERLGLAGGGTMPGSDIYDYVEAADGFAEVFPQHKYNVVEILQQRGHLVAMTGDGVNDAPSLKRADTGIAVEGASDAARSAADIVFLAPGLSAIIDALKTSRQIFHRMYAYVVYRIALSLHLEIFLGLWIAIRDRSLNLELVVFIAIFADIATLAIAYDNAPFSTTPVKWNLPKLWGMSILLGCVLAAGTWITLTTLIAQGENSGIVQNFGHTDAVLFLQICLSENWLIFITRANGPFWSSIPSWQLTAAILLVDILATLFCIFGWFVGGHQTSIVAVVRIWLYSFGVFCVMAGVYYLLQDSVTFDNIVHGKRRRKNKLLKKRDMEDFDMATEMSSPTSTSSLLLSIPPEIKWILYGLIFNNTRIRCRREQPTFITSPHYYWLHLIMPAEYEILFTCRQIYNESRPHFLELATFDLTDMSSSYETFFDALPESTRTHVRTVQGLKITRGVHSQFAPSMKPHITDMERWLGIFDNLTSLTVTVDTVLTLPDERFQGVILSDNGVGNNSNLPFDDILEALVSPYTSTGRMKWSLKPLVDLIQSHPNIRCGVVLKLRTVSGQFRGVKSVDKVVIHLDLALRQARLADSSYNDGVFVAAQRRLSQLDSQSLADNNYAYTQFDTRGTPYPTAHNERKVAWTRGGVFAL